MPTQYTIEARNVMDVSEQTVDAPVEVALSRKTRREAFEAVDVLFDAFGETTSVEMHWEYCPHDNVPEGTFSYD